MNRDFGRALGRCCTRSCMVCMFFDVSLPFDTMDGRIGAGIRFLRHVATELGLVAIAREVDRSGFVARSNSLLVFYYAYQAWSR